MQHNQNEFLSQFKNKIEIIKQAKENNTIGKSASDSLASEFLVVFATGKAWQVAAINEAVKQDKQTKAKGVLFEVRGLVSKARTVAEFFADNQLVDIYIKDNYFNYSMLMACSLENLPSLSTQGLYTKIKEYSATVKSEADIEALAIELVENSLADGESIKTMKATQPELLNTLIFEQKELIRANQAQAQIVSEFETIKQKVLGLSDTQKIELHNLLAETVATFTNLKAVA
jgi:hypothetical protein